MIQQRHVTMHDVARRAGVSVKTVSNVVNDYPFVRDSTRAKVLAAIDELGYSLNMTAKNLRQGHSNIIGLSIPDPRMPYFAELSAYVMEEARVRGKHVIFNPSGVDRQTELDVLHGSFSTLTDGLIFSPLHLNTSDAADIHVDYPLVIIGEHLRLDTYDRVLTENTTGFRNATARLIELGCRRIAIIGVHEWEQDYGSSPYRLKGYRQALAAAGLPNDPALEIPAVIWYQPDGADAVARMLDGGIRPDGIVCMNDLLAMGAMQELARRGICVPQDVKVIGYDDSTDSQYLSPSLSSVDPNLREVARMSLELLCDRIEGRVPEEAGPNGYAEVVVPSRLVERESSAPAITTPYGVTEEPWPVSIARPAVMVRVSGREVMINGQSRSFQLPMKLNMPTVRIAGIEFGRTIWAKMRNSPAPSMRAALSRSFGIEMKNWRSRKMPPTSAIRGMMMPR